MANKKHQIRIRLGLCRRPHWVAHDALPDPLAGFHHPQRLRCLLCSICFFYSAYLLLIFYRSLIALILHNYILLHTHSYRR